MTKEQIEQLINIHSDKLDPDYIETIKERLLDSDEGAAQAAFAKLKSPSVAFILSIITVFDRLYLGEIGMGLLKWFTCGGCWIWWIIDIFSAKKRAQKINSEKILEMI